MSGECDVMKRRHDDSHTPVPLDEGLVLHQGGHLPHGEAHSARAPRPQQSSRGGEEVLF